MRRIIILVPIFLAYVVSSCPDYWTSFQGSCYDLIRNPSTWAGAAEICREFDSQLVAVETADENAFLSSFIKSKNIVTSPTVWLGGNDLMSESHWMWENGELMDYTNWNPGEPNNAIKGENCLELASNSHFTWNDNDCSKHNFFICEKLQSTDPVVG